MALFNFATVATLGLGVATLYVGLFAIFAIASGVFLMPGVFEQVVGAKVNVGGALGSLAEKDQAVREAAYRPRDAAQTEQGDDDQQD